MLNGFMDRPIITYGIRQAQTEVYDSGIRRI
jgi:hypothetical protein